MGNHFWEWVINEKSGGGNNEVEWVKNEKSGGGNNGVEWVKNGKSGGGNNGVEWVIKKTVVGVMEWFQKKTWIRGWLDTPPPGVTTRPFVIIQKLE